MTTTNNCESLIKKVGGIEKAKAIVGGAPNGALTYNTTVRGYSEGWIKTFGNVVINNLHTAIAQYESNNYQETSHCNNSGNYEKRFNSSEVIKQLESDHITDIRNHISPNTKVINHG